MQLLKQSTASTVYVGPVLDSAGAAVTTAVVGDFRLVKNGTAATLSGATVTHDANGYYTVALTTTNTDTTGRLTLAVSNTAMSMSTHRYSVLLASVFDALITNATNATGGLPTATGSISALAGAISTYAGGDTSGVTTLLTRLPSAISLSSGAVTVGTNNDKTGYSLVAGTGLGNQAANITGNLSGSVGSVTSGVTVATNNDKTGYALTQAFPSNFASLAITVGGAVTAGTVSDKTGYSLASGGLAAVTSWSVAITGNITGNLSGSVGSVTSGVTVSTNNDKTGYSLTQSFPSNFASLSVDVSGRVLLQPTQTGVTIPTVTSVTNGVTASTVSDKTGYSLVAGTGLGNQTANITGNISGSVGSVTGNVGGSVASVTNAVTVGTLNAGVITFNAFDTDAINLNAIDGAVYAAIANAVAATQALSRLDSMIESDGAGQFRFDTIALSMGASGGGGTDWSANERTAIRSILGIPASGTTPTDPTVGILDTIRDKTNLITTGTIASSIPVTASGQIDGPLVIGDDYLSANGRAFIWTVALPSAFVIATSTCKFGMEYQDEEGTYSFTVTGTVTDAGSGNVTLTFDVPRTTTGTLGPGWYRWSVEIASASGTEVTRVKSSHNKLVEWVEKQT